MDVASFRSSGTPQNLHQEHENFYFDDSETIGGHISNQASPKGREYPRRHHLLGVAGGSSLAVRSRVPGPFLRSFAFSPEFV